MKIANPFDFPDHFSDLDLCIRVKKILFIFFISLFKKKNNFQIESHVKN